MSPTHGGEAFQFTGHQQRIYGVLVEKSQDLADLYVAALRVFSDQGNPARLKLAAHSIRELADGLPKTFDLPIPVDPALITEQVDDIEPVWNNALKSACHQNGEWIGNIDGPLRKLLQRVWAESAFSAKRKTWFYYRNGVRRLKAYAPLAFLAVDDKRLGEQIAAYIAHRQAKGLEISSINRELQVFRRLLHLAIEWGFAEQTPKIKMLRGEQHREFVLSVEEEAKYLAAAPQPLGSVATVLADTGMRPEECYRLRWEFITWVNGRHGTLMVTHGKTATARRVLPMTPRVRSILESRWEAAGKPLEGYVWPAPSKSGHLEPSSLKKQHAKALRLSNVRPFVLYSLRHTFLTRLGESGCDVWTLARIAGHSSIAISARYVHPSGDSVLTAMARLGGHNSGHSGEMARDGKDPEKLLTAS